MNYFTPELFLEYNSDDTKTAVRAEEKWEAAIRSYRARKALVLRHASDAVSTLANLCLHDGEVISGATVIGADNGISRRAAGAGHEVLPVRMAEELIVVEYSLPTVERTAAPPDWHSHSGPVVWLYDELDLPEKGPGFIHHILLNTGETLDIRFRDVVIYRVPLVRTATRPQPMSPARTV